MRYQDQEDGADGEKYWTTVNAEWPPIVDVDLFNAIQKEVQRRDAKPRNRRRKKRGFYPLDPVCAGCGMPYYGSRLSKAQGRIRTYVHSVPKKRQRPVEHARYSAHGCKQWVVHAHELEDSLVGAIGRVRGSEDYEAQLKDLILARDNHRRAARDAVRRTEAEVGKLEAELGSLVKSISLTAGDDEELKGMLDKQAEPVKRQLAAARADLEECNAFAVSKEETWAAVSELICETENLASLWSSLEDEDPRRKTLFDYWLLDLLIVVEPVPGKKRLNHKSAGARLASIPASPRYVSLGDGSARACSISSRTDDSCSTGTQFPSATATLRAKPSRPARRMADPRENDSHDSSSSAVRNRSTSEGAAVPGCHADGTVGSGSTPTGDSPRPAGRI